MGFVAQTSAVALEGLCACSGSFDWRFEGKFLLVLCALKISLRRDRAALLWNRSGRRGNVCSLSFLVWSEKTSIISDVSDMSEGISRHFGIQQLVDSLTDCAMVLCVFFDQLVGSLCYGALCVF